MTAVIAENTRLEISKEDRLEGKYLTFLLAGEEYGLEILKVREIISVMDITALPQMPAFVKGVINLRGKVIPIVDLRLKFGMPEIDYTKETCTIVVNVAGLLMGIIVDTVSEVLDIAEENIEPPPAFGSSIHANFILGMGKINNKIKILLDIDKVLTSEELSVLEEAGTQPNK